MCDSLTSLLWPFYRRDNQHLHALILYTRGLFLTITNRFYTISSVVITQLWSLSHLRFLGCQVLGLNEIQSRFYSKLFWARLEDVFKIKYLGAFI